MNHNPWDLSSNVNKILQFREERNLKRFHQPKELAAALSIEVSELQKIFLWQGMETMDQVKENGDRVSEISDEISDILIYLLYFANDLEINLSAAVNDKILKNNEKYPISH